MAKINVNVKLEEDIKKEFEQVCDNLGITMTAAFTMLAKQMVREQRIPFEVTMNPSSEHRMRVYNDKYRELLDRDRQ
ncbi:MAG: type II toxin-antitoxin system RelB/DinJ family antitoxin [Lachnospiraceae bacterium]|nr:type II toxin-antitoxin system RelB/DinJ family antitoxin [Lachnospiraceae bacterium]MBQ4069177.1 type II toxin-antitoxin system RelB/DinJ family antitoxin [Lachnospiraceae bacterium]